MKLFYSYSSENNLNILSKIIFYCNQGISFNCLISIQWKSIDFIDSLYNRNDADERTQLKLKRRIVLLLLIKYTKSEIFWENLCRYFQNGLPEGCVVRIAGCNNFIIFGGYLERSKVRWLFSFWICEHFDDLHGFENRLHREVPGKSYLCGDRDPAQF